MNLFVFKDFFDFLVGFGKFVLTQFDELLGTFELLRQSVNVEFIVFHFAHDGFQFAHGFFVFHLDGFRVLSEEWRSEDISLLMEKDGGDEKEENGGVISCTLLYRF